MLPIPPAGRDPAFAALREAPVPDRFDQQMARLRSPGRRTHGPARAAGLAAGLVLVAAACAVPVSVQSPLGYTVRWAVAGMAGESHASARALEAAVPEADRLVTAVDPGVDSTQFRYVVAGPEPDVAPLRAETSVREVHIEALTEPVRVPLGVWAVRRLGASRTVQVGTSRLDDAHVGRLLTMQLADTGIDTSALGLAVGRDGEGLRTIRIRARVNGARDHETLALPVGPATRVHIRDGAILIGRLPPGFRPDSSTFPRSARLYLRQNPGARSGNAAQIDSLLRAQGRSDLADEVRRLIASHPSRTPSTPPTP